MPVSAISTHTNGIEKWLRVAFLCFHYYYLFRDDDLDVARPQQCAILINFCSVSTTNCHSTGTATHHCRRRPCGWNGGRWGWWLSLFLLLMCAHLFLLYFVFFWGFYFFVRSVAQLLNKLPTIHKFTRLSAMCTRRRIDFALFQSIYAQRSPKTK